MQNLLSPLLDAPGAVAADGPDTGVAAHYGEPFAEQRALAEALGVVDTSHRGVIRIGGADRLSWLHSLTTGDLENLQPGGSAQALVLSPSGHVQFHLTLTDDGSATWVHVEPGMAGPLTEFLESMRFMLRVEPQDVTSQYAVLAIMGASEAAVQAAAAATQPAAVTQLSSQPPRIDVLTDRDRLAGTVVALQERGARLAGIWAHEALRIAGQQPRLGLDTDHRTIPHEVGWIGTAVQLDKGCYRGQETVARVHNLGHPPRRLVLLHLDGSEDRLPAHGDRVAVSDAGAGHDPGAEAGADAGAGAEAGESAGRSAGFVGSAARHYELGPVALALVRRAVDVQATLLAAGIPAAQEVVVAPDAGANVTITLRRRGGLLSRGRE